METDRELLEMAAKAVGIMLEWDGPEEFWQPMYYEGKTYKAFNPLEDDGDALRLAVRLGQRGHPLVMFTPDPEDRCAVVRDLLGCPVENITESDSSLDASAQMRRAITRAAAEIYKSSRR